ncbi:MAG: type II toxin-antitoxin system RelE/ParE family toxin [Anaerolineales bacterium]|nr:type II toxin-antitoxin system RelE/ParE family toxin [Anaerolineales bacterium]
MNLLECPQDLLASNSSMNRVSIELHTVFKRHTSEKSMASVLSCYMIQSFADDATEDLFHGRRTKAAQKRLPTGLWKNAAKKLDAVDSAELLFDLRIPPGNRLEALKGDREGQHSIRINDQYRICFTWTEAGPEDVEVVDYH